MASELRRSIKKPCSQKQSVEDYWKKVSETFTGSGERCIWWKIIPQSSLNYLWQPNSTAECNCYSNVVTHPEVDCMDAASHMDQVLQGFTLIHTPGENNRRKLKTQKEPGGLTYILQKNPEKGHISCQTAEIKTLSCTH